MSLPVNNVARDQSVLLPVPINAGKMKAIQAAECPLGSMVCTETAVQLAVRDLDIEMREIASRKVGCAVVSKLACFFALLTSIAISAVEGQSPIAPSDLKAAGPAARLAIETSPEELQARFEATAKGTITERFKAFISKPPVVQTVIFRKKLRQNLSKPALYDGSFERSTNFALFKGIWQPNALLFFQPTNDSGNLSWTPGKEIVSIFNNNQKLLEPGRYLEECSASIGSFENPVTKGIYYCIADLNQLLQGGIMHVQPGNIHWEGNRFSVKTATPDLLTFNIKGELIETNQRPSELRVDYSTGRSAADINAEWIIKYSYKTNTQSEFFPSRIQSYTLLPTGQKVEADDFEVLTIELSNHALSSKAFDLTPLFARPNPSVISD